MKPTSKELLREFYLHSEQDAQNDYQLGALNQAYCQIAEDLDFLEIIKKHLVCKNNKIYLKGIKENGKDHNAIKEYLEK